MYEDIFSILPIIGVILHTSALWITDEKIIRRILLLGCPFCFVYNLVRGAYGSCIGDVLSSISLITAMLRYDYNLSGKTTLLLVRHGESEANKEQIFGGHFNAPLIENGVIQAETTAKYIKENYKVHKVYASDLKRAFVTGSCIAKAVGAEIIKDTGLREIFGGEWEGIKYSEVERLYGEEFEIWKKHTGKARCTGGESVEELGIRVMKTLRKIAEENKGKTVVIATHATPVRVTQCLVNTGSLDEMENTPWVSNASVTELIYKKGKWELGKIGIDEHLSDLRTTLPKSV